MLTRTAIVLVQPQDDLNVGGALRAAWNMGIRDLRLVEPCASDARRMGVTAPGLEAVAAALPRFPSTDDALHDASLAVGFTARTRRAHREIWDLEQLSDAAAAQLAGGGRLHLVFGREDWGLPNEVLDRCNAMVTIPTEADYPSINLAQAVALGTYAVRRVSLRQPTVEESARSELATAAEVQGLVAQALEALHFIEFFKFPGSAETVEGSLRTLLGRATLDQREVRLLRGVFGEVVAFCRRQGVAEPDHRTKT